jgi:uncharacterized membrane protein YqgA involved in biofilm formation
MFSYALYKVVHVLGIALLVSALGAVALHALNGGLRRDNRARALVAAMHGVGLLLVLVGGFGMLARLGLPHGAMFPGWLLVKLAVWLLLGAAVALPYRRPTLARAMLVLVPLLAALAAYMAIYKPV